MSKKKSRGQVSLSCLPDALESREIFFTNLLLLGFEPMESERRHNIPFNRDMFALPNKKAFEVVMHFLFERLNPAMAHEKFRDCWPICDKKQEQAFRRAISNQLTEISNEDPLANLPRIVPSLFMSPGGDRFYSLLLHFSQYVLFKVIKQENGKKDREILQRPKLLPAVSHLGHIMLRTTQAASIRHRKRFLETAQHMVLLHREWKQFANDLVKEHRSLTRQLRQLEHDIRESLAASYDQAQARGNPVTTRRRSGGMTSGERQMQAIKRTQKIQKVRELWKAMDAFYTAQSSERDVVTSILQEVENKYRLDAGEINVQVPEMLLRECQQQLQRRNLGNTYEGGKLSLLTLIQLWNLSLHLYLETIQQAPMPRFEELSPDLVTQVHTHHAHLANTQAMRSSLTNELLPELKASVGRLHRQVKEGKTPSRKDTAKSFQLSSFSLELLPPTPPVSFEPDSGSQDETPTRLPASGSMKNNTSTDTPEAVSMLSEAINKAALRHAGLVQGTPTSTLGELRRQTHGPSKLPIPTSTVYPDSLPNRKRVKSAPSKVVPSTPSLQGRSQHPDTHTPHHDTQALGAGTQKRGQMNGDVTGVHRTQPRRGAESRLSRESKEHRREDKTADKPSSRKKKSIPNIAPASLSEQRTPLNTPKMGSVSSAIRPKTAPRAHNLLAEQIADAVAGGGKITPNFLEMLRVHSQENSPLDLALENPLGGLDQEAFVSRDKLKRTPVTGESSLATPVLTDTPGYRLPSRTLFESDSSPEEPPGHSREPTSVPPGHSREPTSVPPGHSREPTSVSPSDGDVSSLHDSHEGSPSQSVEEHLPGISVGKLIDLEEPAVLHRDTSLPASYDLNHVPEVGLPPEALHDHQRLAGLADDSPVPEKKSEFSEDLEQTLAEIFQTRTPQLSTRSKARIAARDLRTPLSSFKEEEELSLPALGTPLLHQRDTDQLEGLTPNLDLLRQMRIKRQNESNQFLQTQKPINISHTQQDPAIVGSSKVRQVSGGSQKSVTFSDHVDEHSFVDQDLISHDQSIMEIPSGVEYSPSEEPSDQSGHSGQTESLVHGTPSSAPIGNGLESRGKDAGSFLSDIYLTHSPPPPSKPSENVFTSPLDDRLLSDSDLGQDLSMNLSTAIDDLLVPISPDITPSRTPKLASHQTSANSAKPSTQRKFPASVARTGEHNSLVEFSPYQTDDLLDLTSETSAAIEELSNLHLSAVTGSRSPVIPSQNTVEEPLDFSLLDDGDSILLPTSPTVKQGVLVDVNSPSL